MIFLTLVFILALLVGVKFARDKGRLKAFSIFAGLLAAVGFLAPIAVSIFTGGKTNELVISFLILAALLYPFWIVVKKIEKDRKQSKP
ncbi:hypothetical protein APT58_00715 [Corynebacterium glutamicum]|nr:hypothetical protein APT58_00715 [Corynebacterium glutamicum]